MTDKMDTTALVIAAELNELARDYAPTDLAKALAHCGAALLKNQQSRIAELEALQAAPPAPVAVALPLCWVNEDELPESMTDEAYNALLPHSKVDVVRMFPVFGPSAGPAQEHATQLACQGQGFEPTAHFGLAAEQIDKLRTSGLKPEVIAGDDPAAQLNRVRELVWWFARFADVHATPKWLRGHAFELVYYIACMDVKRGIDLEPVKKAAFKEGALISATDRAVLEHLGVLPTAPAQAQEDALDAAELREIQRAVEQFADCGETDVEYALLMRAAQAGHLECTHFQVMNESALNLDAARAAQGSA